MFEQPGFKPTALKAGSDLSGKQYYAMKVSAALTVDVQTAAAGATIGILQNKPIAGQPAEIVTDGISKVNAGGVIAAGDKLTLAADGRLVTSTAGTDKIAGIALNAAAAAGEIISVLLFCQQ